MTLFTKEHPSINQVFAIESSCSAVIDTACTRTVCGEKWLSNFLEKTCDDIPTYSSSRAFKFGDGKVVNSFKWANIPVHIGNTSCKIDTEIVKADIPLLLSKSSIKKGQHSFGFKGRQSDHV